MKIFRFSILILISLSGCFLTESYLTVDQVMFRVKDGNSERLVAQIQVELDAMGFSIEPKLGTDQKNDRKTFFWFKSKKETYAAIKVDPLGCVYFNIKFLAV